MKVQHKKLGRQGAWGQAKDWLNLIELDERLLGKKHFEIAIHEIMHIQNPDWSENMVKKKSKEMCNVLWLLKYRRIDDREKQPKKIYSYKKEDQ